MRPAKGTPAQQLAHARALRDRGWTRSAGRAYRALVSTWPVSAEAVTAQYERARLLETGGNLKEAFEEYQLLIDRYPGRIDFADVLRRQAAIADRIASARSMSWLFGGFTTPERALPFYGQILTNAPAWEHAPAVALAIARIHEENGELAQAATAYADVRFRYPTSPEAEEAAARRVECLWRMTEHAPNNIAALDEAWSASVDFLARHPQSPHAANVRARQEALFRRRAAAAYEAARFYDRRKSSSVVVRAAYERFLAQFPNSPWSEPVRRRLAELGRPKEPTP